MTADSVRISEPVLPEANGFRLFYLKEKISQRRIAESKWQIHSASVLTEYSAHFDANNLLR